MQRFSKEELAEQASIFMKAHGVDSFIATEDGNFFHPKDANLAQDHNAKNVRGEVFIYEAPKELEAIPHIITQNDLDNNEGLAEHVNVGDEVQIPAGETSEKEEPEEVIAPAHISEDVERHGEPVPEPKPKPAAKPKAAAKDKAKK